MNKEVKVVKKKRKLNWQKIFNLISFTFILACIIFYGTRFIRLYLQNNKKEEIKVLADNIKDNNEGNLKNINSDYYFTGKEVNNYVKYSNILFRIIKINKDNSITLISDKPITSLAKGDNNDYKTSYINNWLNNQDKENTGILEKNLNNPNKYLTYTNACNDKIDNTKNITCKSTLADTLITLPSLYDYINTGDTKSFMNNETYYYLLNTNKDNKTWYINDNGGVTTSDNTDILGIKPVITLKSTNKLINGDGTKDNPYTFEEEQSMLGSYVKLGNDTWRVYDIDDNNLKLSLDNYLKINNEEITYKYSDKGYYHNDGKQGTLAYYLNKNYLSKLTYNSNIIEANYANGIYSNTTNYDYTKVLNKTIPTKVATLSIGNIIINSDNTNYYLSTGVDTNSNLVYVMTNDFKLYTKNATSKLKIVPVITIDKKILTSGDGSQSSPLEAK